MAESATCINKKYARKFYCEKCDYTTSKKSSYDTHILSVKHNLKQNETELCQQHICEICNKKYQNRTGLWRHKKVCNNEKKNNTDVVDQLLKQNDEFTPFLI